MQVSWIPYLSLSRSSSIAGNRVITFLLGYPVLFHWLGLIAALGLVFVSAIFRILPLLALALFILFLGIVSWFWSLQSLRGLTFKTTLNRTRAFPGEAVDLTLEVVNGNRLQLTWLEIEKELPHRLVTGVLKSPGPFTRKRLCWTTSISGGQSLKWTHRLECQARG